MITEGSAARLRSAMAWFQNAGHMTPLAMSKIEEIIKEEESE